MFRKFYIYIRYLVKMEFPLPKPTQESFSKWFMKRVDNMDIVYPGLSLPCNTKHRQLRSMLTPQHVFIMRSGTDKFCYYILGNDNVFGRLSKRHYNLCFNNVHLSSIPDKNRIKVYLTSKTVVELPLYRMTFCNRNVLVVAFKRAQRTNA